MNSYTGNCPHGTRIGDLCQSCVHESHMQAIGEPVPLRNIVRTHEATIRELEAQLAASRAEIARLQTQLAEATTPRGEVCKTPLEDIKAKCGQYWNESGIGDAEVHAILEYIHIRVRHAEEELAACRREALEEAAKAVCYYCANNDPIRRSPAHGYQHEAPIAGSLHLKQCAASPIHQLIEKEANGDSR